jgi:hypothetical protein
LRALVRENFGSGKFDTADGEPGGFPGGATLRAPDGITGWVLAELEPTRALGGAMAWAWQEGITDLHLLAPAGAAGTLARRAAEFTDPPRVHVIVGREVEPAVPSPLPAFPELPPQVEPFVRLFAESGAEPVVEHGVLVAEVRGLEVARVVIDDGGEARLEVGVGKHDREAQKLMHPDRQPLDALADAVQAVSELRRADVPRHPMNQLSPSRWLRAIVCARPDLVGARSLAPVPSTIARPDLRLPSPAPAAGDDADGGRVVVVCSTGIDVDLVPAAADERLACEAGGGGEARLVLLLPHVDAHPVTRSLASALCRPADVVTVPADWRTLSAF